ncbi:unnamed protein product [Closterium sp. NIES-64]|nr:unnamed protein product [Closterium sp. NIES-64]
MSLYRVRPRGRVAGNSPCALAFPPLSLSLESALTSHTAHGAAAWEAAYGLQGVSPLPPAAVALPPSVPPAPHLEACSVRSAWRHKVEKRGAQGEAQGWARGAHPQPPWVRGSDASNLGRTREAQRDIWQHQFPAGDCTTQRLLLIEWPASQHGLGSQLHIMSAALSLAMQHSRVLVPTASFDRANHAECNATGALASFHCYFFPLVSPHCERAAADAAAAGQVGECASHEPPARDGVLASERRVVCFHGEPYSALWLEAAVAKRWWGAWYERPNTVEVKGKMAEEADVMPHVHWWRAQSLRFMLRWPSPYLCHLTNRLRHSSLSLSIASRLSSSSALQSSLLRSHPHLKKTLQRNAPPCSSARATSGGDGGASSSRRSNEWGGEGAGEAYLPRPIVSMHVRQSDKGGEMALHSLAAHMWMAYRLRLALPHLRHIWLSSEMQTVIDEAAQYRDWTFLHSSNARTNVSVPHWDVEEAAGRHMVVGSSLAELLTAAQCDFFIGALGSNWVRMINELRSTNGRLLHGFIALNIQEF